MSIFKGSPYRRQDLEAGDDDDDAGEASSGPFDIGSTNHIPIERLRPWRSRMEGVDQRKRVRLTSPEGEDRMSELPDEILVSILSRLTLREVVRTCVLSKRWRCVWTCIPALNFDANDISRHCYRVPLGDHEYNKWVSGVVAQRKRRGPKAINVDEFRVCYDLDKASSSDIDGWIEFALSNSVHTVELSLSNLNKKVFAKNCYILRHEVLGLSALGSSLKNSSSNMFVGFKSLKTLSLKAVKVDDEAVEYILSNCPLLERLSLHLNSALRNLKVVKPSLLLRYLEVVSCWRVKTIEICDTNLVSFTYVGKKPKTMLLKNAPKLVEVSINPCWSVCHAQAMFLQLSCCFSQLENLQLTVYHIKLERWENFILAELKNLKQFVLIVKGWFNGSLLGFLVMIKNWPNLQRFVLQLSYKSSYRHDRFKEAPTANMREAARFWHPCLKVVEITGYCNTCDFELFKHIIEIVVLLEKIIIDTRNPDPDSNSKDSYRELQNDEEQQLRTLLSPGVEFVVL